MGTSSIASSRPRWARSAHSAECGWTFAAPRRTPPAAPRAGTAAAALPGRGDRRGQAALAGGGEIDPGLDPAALSAEYEGAGAMAVSVLTDGPWFGGSLDDLRAVRSARTVPVLRKDFVIDPLQVYEGRAGGADLVLLIVRILDGAMLADMRAMIHELGMTALVEVHDEWELETALGSGAALVGVNNRDLTVFRTDLAVTERLAPYLPGDVLLVSESGIGSRADVERVAAAGADAVLVGEALVRSGRRAGWWRSWGPCRARRGRGRERARQGMRRDDAPGRAHRGRAGADFMGVILSPGFGAQRGSGQCGGDLRGSERSPRGGVRGRGAGGGGAAGRDPRPGRGPAIRERTALAGRRDCRFGAVAGLETVHARSGLSIARAAARYAEVADGILVDAWDPSVPGGTGRTFAWAGTGGEVRGAIGSATFIAAGGMTPENAAAAITALSPDVLDVSSGVESSPGREGSGADERVRGGGANGRRGSRAMTPPTPIDGRFGPFGGRYVPETLIPALDQLAAAYHEASSDPEFLAEVDYLAADYVGRPTPLYRARRFEAEAEVGPVYLKREDLNHTGAHKINNTVGQALLARRMGKPRIIAETGAGQHGVATATACALFDLECVVYMGTEDVERQSLNVYRMELLGAEVRPCRLRHPHPQGRHQRGAARLGHQRGGHPLHHRFGGGAAPLPADRARLPGGDRARGAPPDPGGGGSAPGDGGRVRRRRFERDGDVPRLRPDEEVALVGVEAAGEGLGSGRSSAPLSEGRPGVLHVRSATCCRARTARLRRHIRWRPASTTRAWVRSTPG